MFEKTRAIVLQSLKYSDNSTITTFYTEKLGRLTALIRHSKGKKALSRRGILQPLFLLTINIQYKRNRDIQQCKEIVNSPVFSEIPFDINKSSISMFIAEFLSKTLKEEESNEQLFEYISNSIQILDKSVEGYSNFHILFLIQLTKFLGFQPTQNHNEINIYFNLVKGKFSSNYSKGESLDSETSLKLNKLLSQKMVEIRPVGLSREQRNNLLDSMVRYYQFHLPNIGTIKSIGVLKELYS